MPLPSEKIMQEAIVSRNRAYDGCFYYGVITTGIFCKPSCKSRAAKPDNHRFFPSAEAALLDGFRACKLCYPIENTKVEKLVSIARYIEAHADESLKLAKLAEMAELSESQFQKSFKQAFSISPKTYQDAIRSDKFKSGLKQGLTISDAVYAAGYGSGSRVYGESTRKMGMTPKTYQKNAKGELIRYVFGDTSLGLMLIAATQKGICFAQFAEDEGTLLSMLKQEFSEAEIQASAAQESEELKSWMEAINQHISNDMPRPDLPLDMRGTAFQIKVWKFLLSIKEGDVMSYSELAKRIEKPKAFRAAATACGKNNIGVLIPCHRILRGDGSLGGYRWGLKRKQALLDAEQARKK